MWTTQRILAARKSALAILQIVRLLFFLFYRAWVHYFTCVFENRLAMMQIKSVKRFMELELCSGLNDLQIKHTELFELFNFVVFGSRKAMLWFQGYRRRDLTRKKATVHRTSQSFELLKQLLKLQGQRASFPLHKGDPFFWQIKLDGLSLLQVYQEHVGSQSLLSFQLTLSY